MSDTMEILDADYLENNSEKYKPLAWVEVITDIQPIPGFDNCDMGRVSCGNEVIIKKGEYNVGDECIYVSTDTQLPEDSRWEFLRSNKFRVKCKKMRGAWSDGLVLPMSVISEQDQMKMSVYDCACAGTNGPMLPIGRGYDVTSILGVSKIPEKPINMIGGGANFGKPKGKFPSFLKKTDETNLYGLKPSALLDKHKGKMFRALCKIDGSSGTFYHRNGEFGVCSRNLEIKEDSGGEFWGAANKYELKEKMINYGKNIAVQAEVCSPKIQGNKYKLNDIRIWVHNIFDIDNQKHLDAEEMDNIAKELGLEVCPTAFGPFVLNHTYDELVELVEKPSLLNPEIPEEGVVIRPMKEEYCDLIRDRLSFKIISRLWKDKYKK